MRLQYETPKAWCAGVARDLDALLIDHAHLEKKAAGTAVTLLFRYPEQEALQAPLARLAQEELEHFCVVLEELERRGVSLRRQRASPYAGKLHALVRAAEPVRLLDTLLVAALIEARSCERFALLAGALEGHEPRLAAMYRELLASEARHHGLYLRLAENLGAAEETRARFEALTLEEAEIARALVERAGRPGAPVRLHG